VPELSLVQYSQEQLQEMSLVELAYLLLSEKKEAVSFKELIDEIAALLNLSEEEVRGRIAQFYTDLNIDGRFICIGENRWGLRVWYPYDQTEEETAPTVKPKKKKKAIDEYDDFDDIDEDELDYDDLDEFEEEDDVDLDDEDIIDDEFGLDDADEFDDELLDDEEFDLGDEDLEDELDIDESEEEEL
jgi:DNA-directed RNA polymerase subunit delta